jgi:hypothetical protein
LALEKRLPLFYFFVPIVCVFALQLLFVFRHEEDREVFFNGASS